MTETELTRIERRLKGDKMMPRTRNDTATLIREIRRLNRMISDMSLGAEGDAYDFLAKPDSERDALLPFLPGHEVRLRECKAVEHDNNPRRLFRLWIDQRQSSVVWVDYPMGERFFCSDHNHEGCDCKSVVRQYMRAA